MEFHVGNGTLFHIGGGEKHPRLFVVKNLNELKVEETSNFEERDKTDGNRVISADRIGTERDEVGKHER